MYEYIVLISYFILVLVVRGSGSVASLVRAKSPFIEISCVCDSRNLEPGDRVCATERARSILLNRDERAKIHICIILRVHTMHTHACCMRSPQTHTQARDVMSHESDKDNKLATKNNKISKNNKIADKTAQRARIAERDGDGECARIKYKWK